MSPETSIEHTQVPSSLNEKPKVQVEFAPVELVIDFAGHAICALLHPDVYGYDDDDD